MRFLPLISLAALLASCASGHKPRPASDLNLPSGWHETHYRIGSECMDEAKHFEDALSASGDIDGDGKADEARILENSSTKTQAVFVWLSSRLKTDPPMQLEEFKDSESINNMGISVIEPTGSGIPTLCGKGYVHCAPGDPQDLHLKKAGLAVFQCGGAESVFFWNHETGKFKQVWLSD